MTDRFDRLLRDTVRDLARDADVITDRDRRRLAVHAADRAHTLRARRRGAIAAVVTLVTALTVGLPYGLRYLSSQTEPPVMTLPAGVTEIPGVPTHVIDDTSKPIELVDGWYVLGNKLVLDRTTNIYRGFGNVHETLPSPDGQWVATSSSSGYYRVYNLHNGGSRRYQALNIRERQGWAAWSPDSDTLLLVGRPFDSFIVDEETGEPIHRLMVLSFIDVVREEITYVDVNLTGLACQTCAVTWLTGFELALVLEDPDGTPTGIQILTVDGQRMSTLPVRGYPLGPLAWSPDATIGLVSDSPIPGDGARHMVFASTGEVVPGWEQLARIRQAQWIDDERFLVCESIGERALLSLWSIDGSLLERWLPPTEIVRCSGPSPLAVQLD